MKAAMITVVVFLAIVLILVIVSVRTVPAGHLGVVTTFGKVEDWTLAEGIHLVAFWRSVNPLSLRTQEIMEMAEVPTKEGLTIGLDASVLYSLRRDKTREVFQRIGMNYAEIVIVPQFRSAMRGITVNHDAKELYTASRAVIETKIEASIKEVLESRGITCERVLLRAIRLPNTVKAAIEQKLEAEQLAEKMTWVNKKEEMEAKRKVIEANGISEAQKIIQSTLSDMYVRYLWVKALELAAAKPSTVIYVPIGQDGLPMMLPAKTAEEKK
jgi:regulator of protease activity HflC (stomatin/prohibitin superfamily)